MSKSEEEIYSTIFTALKHPIRRKILRMLSRRAGSFSEMQEVFKVESSHLTYHLESLGDLLFKTKDGKYALSSFGQAAISMMYQVEETPKTPPMLPSLPLKWKACFAVLMAGLILSAGLYYVQYQTLSQISAEYDRTKAELEELQNQYNEAKAESEQLQNEYNRTRAELEQLQNDYAEIEAELEQLQNEYDTLKTDAERLQSDYNETKEELRQLQNAYAKIEAEAKRLQNLLEQYLGSRIIFVDGSNLGDPLENGSFTHPFDMIQEGVNAASPGDLVLVASGTYYEHVTIAKSLTLVGESRSTTIIDGNRTGGWSAKDSVVYVTANNVKISGFKIQNSGGNGHWAFVGGISLTSSNNTIHGNTISNNNYGIILVWNSDNNVISGNAIASNGEWSIHMYGSSHNLILNNTISRNSNGGIWLEGWDNSNNTIRNNFITNNDAGILITGWILIGGSTTLSIYSEIPPSNNTLSGNTVSGNGYGIDIEASGGNTVVGNTISNNGVGIKLLADPYTPSRNNTLYHNNFIDNINQASAAGKNTWYNGYPSGGNYWSDYVGVDLYGGPYQNETGSDGIGDTPYIIDENNTDNYPLMGTWILPEFPSALILPLLMIITLVAIIFRKPFGQRE